MRSSSSAALGLVALLCAAGAWAATDCAQQKLAPAEDAGGYLRAYGNDCTAAQAKEQLARWKIVDTKDKPEQQANLRRMLDAWKEIGEALAKLASEAPATVDGSRSEMKDLYRLMAERADAAREALDAALKQDAAPDVVVFRRAGWQITPQLRLLSFETPKPLPLIQVRTGLDADCATPDSALCASALRTGKAMMLQWRLADTLAAVASQTTLDAVAGQVAAKEAIWNQYLYESKPMLPFDFMLTDWLSGGWSENRDFGKGFPVPPRTQYFLLHPAAAVEYASGAADGQQMKPTLYLEVIGANRWDPKQRWIDAPVLNKWSGVSLIVSYADREGIKDTGYGALFTFDNVYSIGVSRYGSKTGVFLSLDLANLWRDKYKPQYEKYKNTVEALKSAP
ncbi:hypothetical protein AYO46_08795 [Betaproteobacteria bacterium SCGC AG-212-J23]|nr:hypothetical protein AYO46_08795 [Betaproteobacteria bacterium SCGC AG-212-J23]